MERLSALGARGCAFAEEGRMTIEEPARAVVFSAGGTGLGLVELRGFEPLTFSNGQTDGISRNPSAALGPTRSIFNPATDHVA